MAYHSIRQKILEGVLAPGSVIGQEPLARELEVSTTPLREALRRLEAEGLLTQVAHREMRVAPLSRKELDDLYALRIRLEAFGARLGAKNATAGERQVIRALMDEPIPDSKLHQLEHNRALHRAMYGAGANLELSTILDRLWDRADRYRAILLSDDVIADTVHAEHREIVEAFCRGEGAAVAKMTRSHLESGRARLLAVLADALD